MGKLQRWSTRIVVALFFLVGGIEYSVILPTMWDYLHSKGGEEWLYGVSLAAFSISNLVTGPLYGIVFDKTHSTKLIVLFANLFEIGGNFMYFAANSKYMIMGSRFIVGLGAGAGSALFAELARTSSIKERTTIFSVFLSMRQLGLIVGPAFNLFLRKPNFKVGPFSVMAYTAPGALMMILWIILEVMFLLLFRELPPVETGDKQNARHKNNSQNEHQPNGQSARDDVPYQSLDDCSASMLIVQATQINSISDRSETSPLIPHLSSNRYQSCNMSSSSQRNDVLHCHRTGSHLVWLISELLREEMVVLLGILFITMFSQTTTEAMLVPMTEKLLHWDEFKNSLFFCVAGVEIIFAFVVVSVLSRFIGDRWQILGGLVIELFGYAWLIGFTHNSSHATPGILWKVLVGYTFILFGLPLFFVAGGSLYSKLLPPSILGFGQGIRRSVFSTAAILGPLWAGSSGTVNYYILLGTPFGLILLVTLLLILSFSKLKEPTSEDVKVIQETKS